MWLHSHTSFGIRLPFREVDHTKSSLTQTTLLCEVGAESLISGTAGKCGSYVKDVAISG